MSAQSTVPGIVFLMTSERVANLNVLIFQSQAYDGESNKNLSTDE
jgi:hypothetical protein